MAIYYPVDKDGANTLDAYSAHSGYRDPGVVALVPNDDTINAVQHVVPVESNLLALIASNPSARDYRSDVPYACAAGLNEGDPIRVGGDGIMALATADTEPNSRVIGFVRSKPSTTTCYIAHFYRTEAYVGLTPGVIICLQDDGTYGPVSGTFYKPIGVATRTDEIRLNAFTVESFSGASGTSGYSGASGTSATSGFTGMSGTSGYSSPSGYSGESGTSGFSGTFSGASGESGTSGFSGTYSGYSGQSGYSGVSPTINYLFNGVAIKTASEKRNYGVAISDDADLKVTLAASTRYKVKLFIHMYLDGGYTYGGSNYKFNLTYGGTASDSWFQSASIPTDTSSNYVGGMYSTGGTSITGAALATQFYAYTPSSVNCNQVIITGYVQTTTGGVLTLQWCSGTTGYHAWMREGSSLEVTDAGSGAISGANGASGTSGFSGTWSGWSGFSGTPGQSGTSGATAPSGTSGYSGPSGASGFSGAFSGSSGTSGTSGTSGASSYSGASGFSGTSATSGSSGQSGYSGPRGISGQSGASVVGGSGVSGAPGSSGQSGESGTSGFSSQSGLSGKSGASGTSSSGASGFSGEQGDSGRSGYSGKSGVSGPSGASGIGSSGASGTLGTSGKSGFSGLVGPDGDSGISGHSGKSGTSGCSGVGTSGTSGTSGFSGNFSGESGRSGYSGSIGQSGSSGASGSCLQVETLEFVVDGGGQPIQSGQSYVPGMRVPYGCTILDCKLYSDTVGDLAIDLWKCANAVYPPDSTDSITAANYPTITNGVYANASLLGWTTTINADDHLAFFVRTNSCITKFLVSIKVIRT